MVRRVSMTSNAPSTVLPTILRIVTSALRWHLLISWREFLPNLRVDIGRKMHSVENSNRSLTSTAQIKASGASVHRLIRLWGGGRGYWFGWLLYGVNNEVGLRYYVSIE